MNLKILILFLSLTCVCCHFDWSDNDISEEEDDDWSNDLQGVDEDYRGKRGWWWKKKKKNTCLLPKPCHVSLPQYSSKQCTQKRLQAIAIARMWYTITDESQTSTILFPLKFIPWLNQTMAMVDAYYAQDEFESRYALLAAYWIKANTAITAKMEEVFKPYNLYTYKEYQAIYNGFDQAIKKLNNPKNFASFTDDPTFLNVAVTDKWQEDDFFVQNLLTSICPWTIQKVSEKGDVGLKASELKAKLNTTTGLFDAALSRVYSQPITLDQAIRKGRLFVLYHKSHDGMASFPDILDRDAEDTRTMRNTTSPITVLILNKAGHLKLAAIQWDSTPDSPVYTRSTSTNQEWLLAKGMVSMSHMDVCQFKYHLGHCHLNTFVFCLTFRRHLSPKHPLYDIMKFHCEGVVPHITKAWGALAAPQSYGHKLFGISHVGVNKLAAEAYQERKYGMFDLPKLLKTKGLDDKRIKYNPFKEDGQLIWDEYNKFADDVVKEFYKGDADVQQDKELQSFVNEVSIDGTGPDGGKGKYIGFPGQFKSRDELRNFLASFLWLNVIHATVNYNLSPSYIPLEPSKLYKDTHSNAAESYPHDLPDAEVSVGATSFGDLLSYFRANRIMQYYDKVQSKKLKEIVWKSYSKLHGCVNKELSERNAKRKSLGQPGLQILQPKWLTNSIHI